MPTAKELLEAHVHRTGANSFSHDLGACLTLLTRVEKVLEEHSSGWDNSHHQYCQECEKDWPCPTVRILNGEE